MLKNMLCCPAKHFIIFFIGILIFNNQTVKPVDISSIKDTYSILSDDFKHCSPIHGAVWAETQLLKKYYKQMKPKPEVSDATIVLINELFHLVGDTFSVTKTLMPAKHFSPELIGSLIGIIEQNKTKNKKNISKAIQERINGDKDVQADDQRELKKKSIVGGFAALITNSLCECGFINDPKIHVSYPLYTTHTILLGFLYKLSTSKNDFQTYFEQLQATINSKSIFTDNGKKIFEKTDWNTNVFDKNQVDSMIKGCSDESKKLQTDKTIPEFFKNQFESVIFAEIIKQFYQQSLPKVIADTSYKDTVLINEQNEEIGIGFGDCTETTIRNLCNFILYNQDEGKFIPTKTENLNPSQELLDFYQGENADATKHTNPDKHQAWSNLIQNIPGVIYAQIISKTDPNEHYETDHDILKVYGRPCYVLLMQEELEKIDKNKISKPEKNQTNSKLGSSSGDNQIYSENFVKNTCKLMVGIEEDYIVAHPNQYIAYAIWPSLKNIIIILNRLFGLELYKDPLAPFKDEKFCSTYFPRLCEKFGWTYSGPSVPPGTRLVTLNTPYFYWNEYEYGSDNSGNNIHVNLINNPKAQWNINICRSHTEIQKVEGSDDRSGEYRKTLFEAFKQSQFSEDKEYYQLNLYDLLAIYANGEQKDQIIKDIPSNCLLSKTNPLNLKLQKLKDSLFALKNNLELLKTKLEALKLAIKN